MSGFDWQAYLDGSLNAEARKRHDERLSVDPSARLQLEGLRQFRSALKESGQAESVPIDRLRTILSDVARTAKPNRPARKWILGFVGAVAAGLLGWAAFLGVTYDPMRLNTTPTDEILRTSQPDYAARWVRSKTGFPAQPLPLGIALTGARYGKGWACYDYEAAGQAYYLYMSPTAQGFAKAKTVRRDDATYYVGKGIGWKKGALAYYLRGGPEQDRWALAQRAYATLR